MIDEAFASLPWRALSGPLAAAEDALARLDERLAHSPIRDGWISRTHFSDATGSVWLDGQLVPVEDLVLHDARMDIRAPTHELTVAHAVLRARRRILGADPGWALSASGLTTLRGKLGPSAESAPPAEPSTTVDPPEDDSKEDDEGGPLDAELAALDALIARSARVLAGEPAPRPESENKGFILYDCDWDENARLGEWRRVVEQSEALPPVLAAAVVARAWVAIEPLQHAPWLGRLLVAALLRSRQKTKTHLACLNSGLKLIPRQQRVNRDPTVRLMAWIEALRAGAEAGLRDHERWALARTLLQRKLVGRRGNSKLPQLVDLVMARPLASAGMIASHLGVTPRAAQDMVGELGLREATGRGRYRAWGVI